MEHALITVKKMNIEDKEAFSKKLDSVGAGLSHAKSKMRKMTVRKEYYDIIAPMLSSYKATRHMADSIRYWPYGKMPELMPDIPTETDIQKSKASLYPISASQKRDLYLAMQKHPEYTLSGNGFADISGMDAEEILSYFNGTRSERPSILRPTVEVTIEHTYQKRNEYLKQRFDKPIYNYQIEEVTAMLSSHGITLADATHSNVGMNNDTTTPAVIISNLTQYDVINIRNCYGNNPFSEAPITEEAASILSQRLSERGLSLNRDIRYVLPSEYNKLLDYLDGVTGAMPGLLKASPAINPMDVSKLQSFMTAKGITSSIPVSAMSKSDFDRMYGYVLSKGQTPDCVKALTHNIDRTEEFIKSIQTDGITEKKQLLLLQLRNQTNELLSLGIDPAQLEELSHEIEAFRQEYQSLESKCASLSAEYRELLTLKQQLTYAESTSFIFGALFDEKVHEAPEVIERDEKDTKEQKDTISNNSPAGTGKKETLDMDIDL